MGLRLGLGLGLRLGLGVGVRAGHADCTGDAVLPLGRRCLGDALTARRDTHEVGTGAGLRTAAAAVGGSGGGAPGA